MSAIFAFKSRFRESTMRLTAWVRMDNIRAPNQYYVIGYMKLLAIITTILFCCVGCANNQPLREATTANPKPSYKQLSELSFEPLSGTAKIEEITIQTPAFAFEEGASYFKAYQLPATSGNQHLRLTTFIVGAMNMPSAFVFYPYFTFLDQSFNVILRTDPKLRFQENFWDSERAGWVAEVTIPGSARYVIVHTPTSKRGERLYYKDASYAPPGTIVPLKNGALYLSGNWWDVYLPAAGAGRFQVELY